MADSEYLKKKYPQAVKAIDRTGEKIDNPFSFNFNKICSASSFHIKSLYKKKNRKFINLALISMPQIDDDYVPINYTTLEQKWIDEDIESCKRQLAGYSQSFAGKYSRIFQTNIEKAIEDFKADIICINELGMPLQQNLFPSKVAKDFANQQANTNKCLIIAGTAHNRKTSYNTAYLFYPNGPKYGKWYHKQVSAQKLKPHAELIGIPPNRKVIFTNIFGIKISFLICLDLVDYSSVAAVVKLTDAHLVLILCHSEWIEPLNKVAIHLSEAIRGGVAIVNYYHGEVDPSTRLYMYGNKNPIKPTRYSKTNENGSGIDVYKINVKELAEKKISLHPSLNTNIKHLYGMHPVNGY